ncbi:uncharacterized protein [Argopecten irradians]|uniref:uncharacterized protein n=1 Tax=Argopecten irradians TaxID=31199 RepID=UPI0037148380
MEDNTGHTRTVVIAMDSSPCAKKAFQWYVTNLHRPKDHVVVTSVVHVRDAFTTEQWQSLLRSIDSDMLSANAEKYRHTLELELEDLTTMMKQAKVSGRIEFVHSYNARKGILAVVEDCKANCLIVGSRGFKMFEKGILGTTCEELIQTSDVTIILCPN